MPPSAPPNDRYAGATQFRRALDSGGAGRIAGAVVAAAGDPAQAAAHFLSAAAPAAGPAGRTANPGAYPVVAAAAAPGCGWFADRGAGRSAAGTRAQTGGQWSGGAGDRQWLERGQGLGSAPRRDRRSAA